MFSIFSLQWETTLTSENELYPDQTRFTSSCLGCARFANDPFCFGVIIIVIIITINIRIVVIEIFIE